MESSRGDLRRTALAIAVVLILTTLHSYGADFVIGAGGGYSLAFKERRILLYEGTMERLAKPRECLSASIGLSMRNRISLIAEFLYQRYDAIDRTYPEGTLITTWHFGDPIYYVGVSLEYRLFEEVRRSWNPYFSCGFFKLLYLWGAPEYPSSVSIKLGVGTRIRLSGPLYLNPRVAYISGISGLSFQAGLDLIL